MAPKILITGANGMIGTLLQTVLRAKYGCENVIACDIRKPDGEEGPFELCDVTDFDKLNGIATKHKVNWIFHMAAILSAAGEANPQLAMNVNVQGTHNAMEVARLHSLRIFVASTYVIFGPTTPKENTPDVVIARPTTIYGVTKLHAELLGEYYHSKYGVDFRCLRFPSLIAEGDARGRINDYVTEIFEDAVKSGCFTCDVAEDAALPFIYIDDCIDGIVRFMEVDESCLKQRVYNVTAMSLTPSDFAAEIRRHIPEFKIDYAPNPVKVSIINSICKSMDDSNARRDWQWNPKYDLASVAKRMLSRAKARHGK